LVPNIADLIKYYPLDEPLVHIRKKGTRRWGRNENAIRIFFCSPKCRIMGAVEYSTFVYFMSFPRGERRAGCKDVRDNGGNPPILSNIGDLEVYMRLLFLTANHNHFKWLLNLHSTVKIILCREGDHFSTMVEDFNFHAACMVFQGNFFFFLCFWR
jgi:hypothetical protein